MPKTLHIKKANGRTALFSRRKVVTSLLRSGASKGLARDIAERVEKRIEDGKTATDQIYKWAYAELKAARVRPVAARYSLRRAIMELGPSGYPFENFIGEVLAYLGYKKIKVGVTLQGKCVSHEVDVVAVRDNRHYFIEAKFHNRRGYPTNVKVPLYIRSRFLDLQAGLSADDQHVKHEPWIITNTKFTKDAIKYGECMGMNMIGWRYPHEGGLEKLIEDSGLLPVTCITSLKQSEKELLLNNKIVLCQEAVKNKEKLRRLGFSEMRINNLIREYQAAQASARLN